MPPPKRKNKIKNGRFPAASARGVRFFRLFCLYKAERVPPAVRGYGKGCERKFYATNLPSGKGAVVDAESSSVSRQPYEDTARGASGNSARRISPPEKVQSSMQNRRACPARRTRVRQGVRSAILRDESAVYFMGTTSTESLRVHIPSVKSGIACACPPAAIDASERAVMHIHAAAS